MQFPACIAYNDVIRMFNQAEQFSYGDGDSSVNHPAIVWDLWSSEDWDAHCPDFIHLTIIDQPPEQVEGTTVVRLPVESWIRQENNLIVQYEVYTVPNTLV